MNRYLNSFFITSFLYLTCGLIFVYAIREINYETKKEEVITKISLSSVAISQPVEEIVEEIVEETPEPIIEKIVEKPAPKVIEKPKKVEKKLDKKPIDKPVEKVAENINENIEPTEQTAQVENKASQNTHTSNSNAQNVDIESEYLARVKAKIEKNIVYPKTAKRLNQTGKVIVAFDILKDGKVINIRIVHNSKFEKLDEASMELLANIGFFEAIPKEINKTVWNIVIPIHYQIN